MCDSKGTRLLGKSKTVLLACFALIMIAPLQSEAKPMLFKFGDGETIYLIKDVSILGSDNEKLCLGFKMTQTNFFVPLWSSRDGYVLGVKDGKDCGRDEPKYSEMGFWKRIPVFLYLSGGNTAETFYPLTDTDIKSYQQSGWLDDPLPVFERTFAERFPLLAVGVPFIFLYFCWLGIRRLFRRSV